MKKFLVRVVLFLLLVAVCDYAVGRFAEHSVRSAGSGMIHKLHYIINTSASDVVVLGSSRGFRHYDPAIIGDSLSMTAYNIGMDGKGILHMYPYLANLTQRHQPKVVIYDIFPNFDLYDDNAENYMEYLRYLKGCEAADSVMQEIDPKAPYKMLSHIYTYNSHFPSILKCLLSDKDTYVQGFQPMTGTLASDTEPTHFTSRPYSELKLRSLDRMAWLCRDLGIRLIVTISPFYGTFDENDIDYIKEYCNHNDAIFIDFSQHPQFEGHTELFTDTYHLNDKGAQIFSTLIADSIRSCLNLPQ